MNQRGESLVRFLLTLVGLLLLGSVVVALAVTVMHGLITWALWRG